MDPLFLSLLLLFGAVLVDANAPKRGRLRIVRSVREGRTLVTGDTFPLRRELRAMGGRWSDVDKAWAWEEEVDVDRLLAQLPDRVDLIDAGSSTVRTGQILSLPTRPAPARPPTGHTGEIVGLPGVESGELPGVSLQDLLRSRAIRFGTSAPFRLTSVVFARKVYLGWDEPAVIVYGFAREDRTGDVTPVVKQLAFRYADTYRIGLRGHVPSVRIGRTRVVPDDNPSGEPGRSRRMEEVTWVFPANVPALPYVNPETFVQVDARGDVVDPPEGWYWQRFPSDEHARLHPATVRWDRGRIWRELHGR